MRPQGSESGSTSLVCADGRRQQALLPAFPDKPPQAAQIRDPGAGTETARGCSGIGTLAPGSRICALRACPGRQDEEPESAPVSAFVERQTSTIACQPEFEGLMRPDPGSAPQTGCEIGRVACRERVWQSVENSV